jgi:hypothetical protein
MLIVLDLMLPLDRHRDAHRARDVDTDHDGGVFREAFLVVDLGSGLDDVVDVLGFGDLLIIQVYLVLVVAELTGPGLLFFLHLLGSLVDLGVDVENRVAAGTDAGVSGCDLDSCVFDAPHAHLEDIRVNFLLVDPGFSLLLVPFGLAADVMR